MALVTNPVLIVEVASKQIMDGNDATVALTGYSKAELIGKTLDELCAPETVALILEGCVPRHILHGTSAFSNVGHGSTSTVEGSIPGQNCSTAHILGESRFCPKGKSPAPQADVMHDGGGCEGIANRV
jgi:hypothetical protein